MMGVDCDRTRIVPRKLPSVFQKSYARRAVNPDKGFTLPATERDLGSALPVDIIPCHVSLRALLKE